LTGILTGFSCFILDIFCNLFLTYKNYITLKFIQGNDYNIGVTFFIICSLIYGCVSTLMTTYFQPVAFGGGLAQIKAYLNGTNIPKLFVPSCGIVRLFGSALAIGSGL